MIASVIDVTLSDTKSFEALHCHYFVPGLPPSDRGVRYYDKRVYMSVGLCVCLSACISQRPPHIQTSQNFLYVLIVTVDRSSSDVNTGRYVLPVFCMTSCLPIIGQAYATPIRHILKVTHQRAAPGQSLTSEIAF